MRRRRPSASSTRSRAITCRRSARWRWRWRWCRRSPWRRLVDLDLPGSGAAPHRLSLRARHLDAGGDRLGACGRRAPRPPGQGRRRARSDRQGEGDRLRQDRHAHRGQAESDRYRGASATSRGGGAAHRGGGGERLVASAGGRHRRACEGATASPFTPASHAEVLPGKGVERQGRRRRIVTIGAPGAARDHQRRSLARPRGLEAEGKKRLGAAGGKARSLGLIALRDEPRADALQGLKTSPASASGP